MFFTALCTDRGGGDYCLVVRLAAPGGEKYFARLTPQPQSNTLARTEKLLCCALTYAVKG